MASRGRRSPAASDSKTPSTCSAQSAAHTATIRRSASLSVCEELTRTVFQAARDDGSGRCRRDAPAEIDAEQFERQNAALVVTEPIAA
jgi:hypothetical protein